MLYGVPKKGKRILLSEYLNLTVQLPFGIAYEKNETENENIDYNIVKFESTPSGYKSGMFSPKDEDIILWKLTGQRAFIVDYHAEDSSQITPEIIRENMKGNLEGIAENFAQSDPLSGNQAFSGLLQHAGGKKELFSVSEKTTAVVVKQEYQGMFGVSTGLYYLIVAVENCPEADLFVAMLRGQGKDLAFYKKELLPILKTLETGYPGKEDKQKEKGEPVSEAVKRLDFSKGERMKTGEFSILIPEGMCASGEISPQTRYLTAVTAGVTFDRPDWEDASPILFSFQTGQKIPEIREPLDSKEGEKQLLELAEQIHFQPAQKKRKLISEKIGRFHKLASTPESYICYEQEENPGWVTFRFYIFSRKFLYTGIYTGIPEGLETPEKTHLEILEKWLSTVRYEGENPDVKLHYNRQMFGEFTAEDGKLDGIKISQLFSGDVLFFNEGCFEEKEGRHEATGLQFNGAKQSEFPQLAKNYQAFGSAVIEFLNELDQIQELRVAKERIHKDLLPLLLNDFSVPLTGMTLMNLLAWHMVYIRTDLLHPNDYTIVLDRNLAAAIPDAYGYMAKFVDALRRYNGRTGKFTLSFLTVANFDSPLAGRIKPVAGAAQMRESCKLAVKNGAIEELPGDKGKGAGTPVRTPKTKGDGEKDLFDPNPSVCLRGKAFVLTGTFEHEGGDREKIARLILKKGGRVTGAVSGKTDYLVIGKLGNFGQKTAGQAKEQRAKGSGIQVIREEDLLCALEEKKPSAKGKKSGGEKPAAKGKQPGEEKPAASGKKLDQGKPAANRTKTGTKPAPAKTAPPETTASKTAPKQSEDMRKEQIEEKRKAAVEQYLKQVTADFEKKKQELEKEIDSLRKEKEQYEQELSSAGFFQFSKKSSLKQIIRGLDVQYAGKQSELTELEKQKEEALKEPCFKIDRKIREELASEMKEIVNGNLRTLSEKDQELGLLIVSMLGMDPITHQEIIESAKLLGINANALRVANIMRKLGACSGKVTKSLYLYGIRGEPREYTGYYL